MTRPKEGSRPSRYCKSSAKHDRHSPADSDSFTAMQSFSSTSIEDDSLSSRRQFANVNQLDSFKGEDSFSRQKEQLSSAQSALMKAQQNMESMRHRIRSSGGFEPDSLLYLSDGAGNDLLANVMGYLTVDEIARSEMVCVTMRKSAGRCWEEIHRESHGGARTSEESRYTFRESVIRKHLANTFDSDEFDDEVLDADAIYEARSTHSSRVVREMPPELTHPTSQADSGTKPSYCSCTETYTWHLELVSVLLFVLGSVLYLVCSIYDYQWSHTLLEVPEWLRGMDDDAVWTRYRLEEQYGHVLESDETDNSDNNPRMLGGVRRRRRPLSSVVDSSDDYDIGYRFNSRRAAEKRINRSLLTSRTLGEPFQQRLVRGSKGRRRQRQQSWTVVDSNKNNADGKQDYHNLQSKTPEELYYDLDWAELPPEIQNAYTVLGYNQNAWDNEVPVEADNYGWDELSPEQVEAATSIGYTEMIWCEWDDSMIMTAGPSSGLTISKSPSVQPTSASSLSPSVSPTLNSSTSMTTTQTPFLPSTPSNQPYVSETSSPTMKFWMLGISYYPPSNKPSVAPSILSEIPSVVNASSPSGYLSPSPSTSLEPSSFSISPSISSPPTSSPKPTQLSITSVAPDEAYADEWWRDLPPDIQNAYAILGWNETMWDAEINPPSENMTWSELSEAMQEAAKYLGYTQQTWDLEEESVTIGDDLSMNNGVLSAPSSSPIFTSPESINMVPAPTAPDEMYADEWWRDLSPDIQDAYAVLGWNETTWDSGSNPPSENMTWSELSEDMQEAASYLGYTQATWDVEEVVAEESLLAQNYTSTDSNNYYDDYDWAELPPDVQSAARILGYDQSTWDSGGAAWSDEYFWDDLSPEAQEAAAVMGYAEAAWNASGDEDLEALLVAAGGSYVSNDDDYVFEVGASNIPVSEYQIIYFFAALCFLIVGMLDLARERAPYHVFMILAGLLGVISSVFVEENLGLSNILDTLSVHLYLLEGVTLLVNNVKRDLTDEEMWYKRLVIFADLEFIGGAVLDVMLSYFYLLDDTSDWDTGLAITWVFSAVLWLHCALIYLGLFVYDTIEEKKEIVEDVADSGSLASVSI